MRKTFYVYLHSDKNGGHTTYVALIDTLAFKNERAASVENAQHQARLWVQENMGHGTRIEWILRDDRQFASDMKRTDPDQPATIADRIHTW